MGKKIQMKKENEYLESIDKSLRILSKEMKATKDLKILELKNRNRTTYFELLKDQCLMFILGIVVGCMLYQLGIDLLR